MPARRGSLGVRARLLGARASHFVLGALCAVCGACAGANASVRPATNPGDAGQGSAKKVERIDLPETVITAGPKAELALADLTQDQLFDGGTKAFQAGDWTKATLHFDRFLALYPDSNDWASAVWNAGLAHERLSEWRLALERWETLLARASRIPADVKHASDLGDEVDIAFHAALDEHELGKLDDAIERLHALSERPGVQLARQAEAMVQEAVCRIERAKVARAAAADGSITEAQKVGLNGRAEGERLLRRALEVYEKAAADGSADSGLLAQAEFWIGEVYRSYFDETALDPKAMQEKALMDALETKAQFLLSAQGHFLRAIRKGDGEWATASGFKIGELYESFHEQIVNAPLPPGLDAEQQAVYREELKKKVRILLDKAMKVYEQTLATAQRVNAQSPYVAKTSEALARMRALLLEGAPRTN